MNNFDLERPLMNDPQLMLERLFDFADINRSIDTKELWDIQRKWDGQNNLYRLSVSILAHDDMDRLRQLVCEWGLDWD